MEFTPISNIYPAIEEYANRESELKTHSKAICKVMTSPTVNQLESQLSLFLENLLLDATDPNEALDEIFSELLAVKIHLYEALSATVESCIQFNCVKHIFPTFQKIGSLSGDPIFCFFTAFMALNLNDHQTCIQFCQKSSSQSSDFHALEAQAHFEQGNYLKASENYELASEENPLNPMYWYWLAKTYFLTDQTRESWEAALQCVKLQSEDIEACTLLSIIALEAKTNIDYLNTSWDYLRKFLPEKNYQAGVFTHLSKIAMALKDEKKILEAIREIDFESLRKSKFFQGDLTEILKSLNNHKFIEAHTKLIDLVTNQG